MSKVAKFIVRDGIEYYSLPAVAKMLETTTTKVKALISKEGWEFSNFRVNGRTLYVKAEDVNSFIRLGSIISSDTTHKAVNTNKEPQVSQNINVKIPKSDNGPRQVVLTASDAYSLLSVLETLPSVRSEPWYTRLLEQVRKL